MEFMKQKIIITGALVLLAAGVGFITWDLLYNNSETRKNPYEYDLEKLRRNDSVKIEYTETLQFSPSLKEIHGVCTDGRDRILVSGRNGVEIFDNTGKKVTSFQTEGMVLSLTTDSKGNVLLGVTDHVEIWDPHGRMIRKWGAADKESVITSLATTGTDVFVADAGKRAVYRYDYAGNLKSRIAEKDSLKGIPGLVIPSPYFDLGIGRDGELWVVNPGRHIFEAFSFDGSPVSTWGRAAMEVDGFCGCCNPSNFAILSDGSFVTSEKGIERVKVYQPNGELKCLVATPEMFREGTKGIDLAVDSKDRVIVLDPGKGLIRIFEKKL
jgi:hypothetical protein